MALNRAGSGKELQDLEMWYMVFISNIPLGVGANLEFIDTLLRNLVRI